MIFKWDCIIKICHGLSLKKSSPANQMFTSAWKSLWVEAKDVWRLNLRPCLVKKPKYPCISPKRPDNWSAYNPWYTNIVQNFADKLYHTFKKRPDQFDASISFLVPHYYLRFNDNGTTMVNEEFNIYKSYLLKLKEKSKFSMIQAD